MLHYHPFFKRLSFFSQLPHHFCDLLRSSRHDLFFAFLPLLLELLPRPLEVPMELPLIFFMLFLRPQHRELRPLEDRQHVLGCLVHLIWLHHSCCL